MSSKFYVLYLYILRGSQQHKEPLKPAPMQRARRKSSIGASSEKSVLNQQSAIAPQIANGTKAQPSRLSLLKKIGRSLSRWLRESTEPKVWQVRDRSGNTYWRIYDPVSGRSITCANEREARIWLEQLHFY